MLDIMPESHYARSSIHYASMVTRLGHTQISDLMCIASLFCISVYFVYRGRITISTVQWNLAKRGMKISDPIFPIEMDLAKRGINVKS